MDSLPKQVRYIFITGGVSSSLGKGVSIASIGTLLEAHNYKVSIQKLDPYINVDPGTMNPHQHGEVYVTPDGAETDLDLGYYERFTSSTLTSDHSVSTGQIYDTVIRQEREGRFLGATVQVIPHITNEIKKKIRIFEKKDPELDFILVEIGGTVGDIESFPFLESIRQLRLDLGVESTLYIHLTYVPTLRVSGEIKTKPTQHSVKELRQVGVQPDMLVCRSEKKLSDTLKQKISLFCNIAPDRVISAPDVETTIYEVPLMFSDEGIDVQILKYFDLFESPPMLDKQWNPLLQKWSKVVHTLKHPKHKTNIAIIGKYTAVKDAYRSIYESLSHGGIENQCFVNFVLVDATKLMKDNVEELVKNFSGILVPGGFGESGIEGKVLSVRYARENRIPFLGICLGLQCSVIEFARNVIGWKDANSKEIDETTPHPVVDIMPEQLDVTNKGGSMHLGSLNPSSLLFQIYKKNKIVERYRHRFEFIMQHQKEFEKHGMLISATSLDGKRAHSIELAQEKHPWFIATQFHPEFQSSPLRPHPLFTHFIEASLVYSENLTTT